MRKPITIILALLIALSPIIALAETVNFAALLTSEENRNLGNEDGVYNAMYKILMKANGKDFPLNDWIMASTCISKNAIGEALEPDEMVFDESLSAYEKFFLLSLSTATLTDEEAQELNTILGKALKTFPADGEDLYVGTEEDGYISGLMREVTEKMGYSYVPEAVNDALTLYSIQDKDGNMVLSASEVLTSLPHAILMKHVPAEKRQESAAAMARAEASIPYKIDWKKLASGNDASYDNLDDLDSFFEDSDEEGDSEGSGDNTEKPEETKVELTDEQVAQWTEKWLKLYFACDAYDAAPDDTNYNALSAALLDMVEDKPEVTHEPDGGISLKYAAAATTNSTAASTSSTSSSSGSSNSTAKALVELKEPYTGYTGKYIIYISKKTCTIGIVGRGSDNRFTKKVKTFPTSIGKAGQTREGTFWIYKKERWHSWSGASYSPYCSKQDGGSYIHGPMYTAKDSNSMIASSYNSIGTQSSAGCLGTVCGAAGWIYYNCPTGTMVMIANDSKFSASRPKKIDDDQTYDPTEKSVKATQTTDTEPTVSPSPSATTDATTTPAASVTNTPAPSVTNTPAPAVTNTPAPEAITALDIKQLHSLLIFYYGNQVDLADDIAKGVIGTNTLAAMNRFRSEYTAADGARLQTPSTESKSSVTALLGALMTTNPVKTAISALQDNLIKVNKLTAQDKAAAQSAAVTYDQKTSDAVAAFQKEKAANRLAETGVADLNTIALLDQTANPSAATPTPTPTAVTALESIEVTPPQSTMGIGDTVALNVVATPENIENLTYLYTSGDVNVAAVDSNGTIKAIDSGETTITVTPQINGAPVEDKAKTVSITVYSALKQGDSGEAVSRVQKMLVACGKLSTERKHDKNAIDGDFGGNTQKAVSSFQGDKGLEQTGIVDSKTLNALEAAYDDVLDAAEARLIKLKLLSDDEDEDFTESQIETAVKKFQKAYNAKLPEDANSDDKLYEDGILDKLTQAALKSAVEASEKPEDEKTPDDEPADDEPTEEPASGDVTSPTQPQKTAAPEEDDDGKSDGTVTEHTDGTTNVTLDDTSKDDAFEKVEEIPEESDTTEESGNAEEIPAKQEDAPEEEIPESHSQDTEESKASEEEKEALEDSQPDEEKIEKAEEVVEEKNVEAQSAADDFEPDSPAE